MGRYANYLQSAHWQKTRARILSRAKGKCEECRTRPAMQVHHKTYARIGKELDSDLIALCVPCHAKKHPDKDMLPERPSFVGEHACRMCPSETADVFVGTREILYICTGCGETDRRPREKGKRRKRNKQRPKKPKETREEQWARMQAEHEAKVLARAARKRSDPVHHWTF